MDKREIGLHLFRGVYLAAGVALAALVALCWFAWGWRVAAGMAAGGAISIAVILSWHWLAAWILAAPGGRTRRRLIIVWPLKYAVIGGALWALLRWNLVNVVALVVGLGLMQAIIFGRVLLAARALTAAPAGARDEQGN